MLIQFHVLCSRLDLSVHLPSFIAEITPARTGVPIATSILNVVEIDLDMGLPMEFYSALHRATEHSEK